MLGTSATRLTVVTNRSFEVTLYDYRQPAPQHKRFAVGQMAQDDTLPGTREPRETTMDLRGSCGAAAVAACV